MFQLHTDFQLTALRGLLGRRANCWNFYSQISIAQLLHTFGFVSYLHDLYFDCFQTTKRHSYNNCSIHKTIFSSFHEAVYPVGVTTNRFCFTQIIGHKSLTVQQVCTKCDTRIRLWTPFLCAKCQGDRSKVYVGIMSHLR